MRKNRYLLGSGWALAVLLPLMFSARPCRADLVDVEFDQGKPSILSYLGTLTYDAGSQNFHSELTPLTFSAPFVSGGFTSFTGGKTTVDLSVDSSGHFVSNGTGFRLTGALTINGMNFTGTDADPLLFGHITAFGTEDPGPPTRVFDGLFGIDGGQLIGSGGFMIGEMAGFMIFAENVDIGTLGDFKQDFKSTSDKALFGPVVPEPSSWVLAWIAVGLVAGLGFLRKRVFRSC